VIGEDKEAKSNLGDQVCQVLPATAVSAKNKTNKRRINKSHFSRWGRSSAGWLRLRTSNS
jgi:hypothetical protein